MAPRMARPPTKEDIAKRKADAKIYNAKAKTLKVVHEYTILSNSLDSDRCSKACMHLSEKWPPVTGSPYYVCSLFDRTLGNDAAGTLRTNQCKKEAK